MFRRKPTKRVVVVGALLLLLTFCGLLLAKHVSDNTNDDNQELGPATSQALDEPATEDIPEDTTGRYKEACDVFDESKVDQIIGEGWQRNKVVGTYYGTNGKTSICEYQVATNKITATVTQYPFPEEAAAAKDEKIKSNDQFSVGLKNLYVVSVLTTVDGQNDKESSDTLLNGMLEKL